MICVDLNDKVVIPSVRETKFLKKACETSSPIVLLSETHIGNLLSLVSFVHKQHKLAYADLELIGGFKADINGIRLLKNMYHLDGIFTTNIKAVKIAKQFGLVVCYRFFLIDSRSLERTSKILKAHSKNFDVIELLPAECGLQKIESIREIIGEHKYIIGGFIRNKGFIDKAFVKGITAVTTSETSLWT